MRVLSSRAHGIMDYLMGILLIVAPWLLDFARGGAETWVPVALGAGLILYSLFTDYEYSISKTIAMRTHLALDLVSGILLAASPWLFGFSEYVYLPHLILGIVEAVASLVTERVPASSTAQSEHRHAH
jgi:hypothetical protein